MPDTNPIVYVTRDPEIVAAVKQQAERQRTWLKDVSEAISYLLPWSTGAFRVRDMFGPSSVGPIQIQPDRIDGPRAAGWKLAAGRSDEIVPMKGARGTTARQFIADLGTCPTVPMVIGAHGAPEYVSTPTGDGRELITGARARVIGGAVWVEYPAEPTESNVSRFSTNHRGAPDGRWERAKLSAYYAALESAESAVATA